jgi:hypothetical protein
MVSEATCTFNDKKAGVSFHPYEAPTQSTSRAESLIPSSQPVESNEQAINPEQPLLTLPEAARADPEDPWKLALRFSQADDLYSEAFGSDMHIDLNTVFGVDSNDYLHTFGEQFGGAESASSAPDYNTLWPAVSNFFQDNPISASSAFPAVTQQGGGKSAEPFVPHGLSSRAPSPGHPSEADIDWLTAWDPRKDDTENGTLPPSRLEDVTSRHCFYQQE